MWFALCHLPPKTSIYLEGARITVERQELHWVTPDTRSLTAAGSGKSVLGSLSDQHLFPEGISLLQLIKVVLLVVPLRHVLPPPETLTGCPVWSFYVQGSYSVPPQSLSKETQFLPVSFISLIKDILPYCLQFRWRLLSKLGKALNVVAALRFLWSFKNTYPS